MAKYISDVVDYFQNLCVQHPLLEHGEAAGRRVFEVVAYDEALGDFRSAAKEKDFFVRFILPTMAWKNHGNNAMKHYQCGIMVGKYYSTKEADKTAKITAWAAAERVADDFIARMLNDSREGHALFNSTIDLVENAQLSGDFMDAQGDGSYASVMYLFDFGTFRCVEPTGSDFVAAGWLDLQ
jgi:hypothetical protein